MKKKYRKGQRPIVISQQKFQELQDELALQNLLLSAAYLMDEEGYNDAQIVEFWQSLTRWAEAIDEHLISIQTVADIIEKETGLKCVSSTLKRNQ